MKTTNLQMSKDCQMPSKITEGLKANSLDYLVLPMLTIDEYDSKIDNNRVVVIGFFVIDKDPADDLAGFVDKSSISVLDVEVSPAPTPEGYYVVFVEMLRNTDLPRELSKVLNEVKNLCNIDQWQMQFAGQSEPIDLTDESIAENIVLDPAELAEKEKLKKIKKKKKRKAKIAEDFDFWYYCDADKVDINEDQITFTKNQYQYSYELDNDIPIGAINLIESSAVNALQKILGNQYNVWSMHDKLVVERCEQVKVLKLQD
jgi:hypothetical protein